jgi:type VI secretion system secreted protein VgrG
MESDHLGDATPCAGRSIESYEYPGDYAGSGARASRRGGCCTRQERGGDQRSRAVGDCLSLGAGALVELGGDPVPGTGGKRYLCLSASHHFQSEAYGSGGDTAAAAMPFRAAMC